MSQFGTIGGFLGGLGLFLLGMTLMTEGLKIAGGRALRHILSDWTSTRLRGLLSGAAITALVQSSSAVTLATIGFANAGLLMLGQAIWIIFGANLGTTMTGWLVALVGLEIRIESFALPLVGIGALLHLFAPHTRSKSLGTAVAGFGLLLLGIGVLRDSFVGVSAAIDLGALAQPGLLGSMAMVVIGAVLTVVMMSSSASTALIITAAMSGVVPLPAAAAAIIGANLGTSVKAVFAALGATANARRVAAAHVIFNLVIAVAAFLLLPVFLFGVDRMAGANPPPAPLLALFHTAINFIGVALMVPIEPRMTAFLLGRFRAGEEEIAIPRYLDRSTTGVPDLALRALIMELERLGATTLAIGRAAVGPGTPDAKQIAREREAVGVLVDTVSEFSHHVALGQVPENIVEAFTDGVRVAQYDLAIVECATAIAGLRRPTGPQLHQEIAARRHSWQQRVVLLLELADTMGGGFDADAAEALHTEVEGDYHTLKQAILRAGTAGALSVPEMERQLSLISQARRMATQAVKAARHMSSLLALTHPADSGGEMQEQRG